VSEDPDFLEARLAHARRRVDDATPYSPDWDAATEAVDDLTRRLVRARRDGGTRLLTREAARLAG
jgi:hypothetical protein